MQTAIQIGASVCKMIELAGKFWQMESALRDDLASIWKKKKFPFGFDDLFLRTAFPA